MTVAGLTYLMPHRLEQIVSGGQTGADRAALDAAIEMGIPHGGWCPRGRKAEDGVIPEIYQLRETVGSSYLARTEKNVKVSDGTVIFTMRGLNGGSARTADFARRHRRPWIHFELGVTALDDVVGKLIAFLDENNIRRLNVAGSRAESEPEIYEPVRELIIRLAR